MKKFNITVVFDDGLSSVITNVRAESKAKAFLLITDDYFKKQQETILSITIIECKPYTMMGEHYA